MIHKLLKYLQEQSVNYAIINGSESLFENDSELGDIDILFKKDDFKNIEQILKTFCKTERFKIVQIYHQEVYAKNIFIFNPNTTQLLNLDIYGKLHRKNTVYFSETEIFNNLQQFKGVNSLATHQEFFHYLFKKADKNDVSETAFQYLRKLFLKDEKACESVIKNNIKAESDNLIKAFKNNDNTLLLTSIEALKNDVKTNPKQSINYRIKNKFRVLKRTIKPTGISIVFLGPDGSGKSTIIDGLTNKILPFRKTSYFHLKPIIAKSDNSAATINPHEFAPYSKLKSFVKLLFFIWQYNKGWIKNIYPSKIKSTLIIFDRYYDDLIVDSKRYRYGGSINLAKFVRFFIPKPALYFILTADADIIFKRKQEVTLTELQTQIKNYRGLTNNAQYHNIDVDKSPDAIVNEVFNILMKKMNERY